jgi:hypothetical protein
MSIVDNKGISIIIDETGIGLFTMMIQTWQENGVPSEGYIAELYDRKESIKKSTY